MKCIVYIIAWRPASISIFERIAALISLRIALSCCGLSCWIADWVWTADLPSSWWGAGIVEIELNLQNTVWARIWTSVFQFNIYMCGKPNDQVKRNGIYSEFAGLWAIIAGIAINPQDITSSINLHIEFSRRRAQFHFCKIKPKNKK